MSYDLDVYTRQTGDRRRLTDLVCSLAGLTLAADDAESVRVIRGLRGTYSFTVDGPFDVESEDVPVDVSEHVLCARHLWRILVEGGSSGEIPHAVRCGRLLARELDGAVVDQQTGEVWSRSRSRSVNKPLRDERISEIGLHWFCLRDDLAPSTPEIYLDTVRRHLPEALPRRFGEHEPFPGRYEQAGAEGFRDTWQRATGSIYFAGTGPVIGGHLGAGPADRFPSKFWSASLALHAHVFDDPSWRAALRETFIDLADALPAFFATAQVTRGHIWSGRSSWSDGRTEPAVVAVRRHEGWTGIPPIPMWWTWLGRPFDDHAAALPRARTTTTRAGILFEADPYPRPAEELEHLTSWLPHDLFASLAPNPDRIQPVPLVGASTIPAELR
ncbi:hypothetical protein [Gordonia neofelifaecis]|uniref:DUF3396 domain-containing protein n=1 Tax=Gordonia neofelifaecis NRRL B-59395 TaxID=644548 RepID=F1YEI6_9ACTN|nr:hypothetical protein [Gordonia neofelifaecis]EGD56819.1 hypothetical protein SCNU_00535 [Gordonia neofelifaecis NRRL B-59395]